MESDYAYNLIMLFWARCLLEWVTVCNTAAIVHEGSSPSAPTNYIRFMSGCWVAANPLCSGHSHREFESRRPA